MKLLTGCGGWGYFNVPGNRLESYSRAYDFVETNVTFYRMTTQEQLENWRATVPKTFEFTVKCNRGLTHEEALKPTERAFEIFDGMRRVCKELRAEILVLQTPPSFDTAESEIRELLSRANTKGLTLVWEPRGENRNTYLKLARDLGIVTSVDISVEEPMGKQDILYTRVFGPDRKKDIPDRSLERIENRTRASGAKKGYVTFHGSKMYKDAARFLVYRKG